MDDSATQSERGSFPGWLRIAQIMAILAGAVIGLSPWFARSGSPRVAFGYLLIVGLVAGLYQARTPPKIARAPIFAEWASAFGLTVFAFTTGAMFLLAGEGLIRFVVFGVKRLAGLFEAEVAISGGRAGFWIAAALALLVVPSVAAMSARQSAVLLHPRLGARPRLFGLTRRLAGTSVMVISAVAIVGWVVFGWKYLVQAPISFREAFGWVFVLLFASVPAKSAADGHQQWLDQQTPSDDSSLPTGGRRQELALPIRSLFSAAGFEVHSPDSGRSLLTRVDFQAKRGGLELLVKVAVQESGIGQDSLPTASALGSAARILSRRSDSGRHHGVLLLLGDRAQVTSDEWVTVALASHAEAVIVSEAIAAGDEDAAQRAEAFVERCLMEAR